jgi:hypothetical protein
VKTAPSHTVIALTGLSRLRIQVQRMLQHLHRSTCKLLFFQKL